jgi:hypothetical protein
MNEQRADEDDPSNSKNSISLQPCGCSMTLVTAGLEQVRYRKTSNRSRASVHDNENG